MLLHTQLIFTMDYNAKSMAASNTPAVDINVDMDEVLKRIQVNISAVKRSICFTMTSRRAGMWRG